MIILTHVSPGLVSQADRENLTSIRRGSGGGWFAMVYGNNLLNLI